MFRLENFYYFGIETAYWTVFTLGKSNEAIFRNAYDFRLFTGFQHVVRERFQNV